MEEWKVEVRDLEYSSRRFRLSPVNFRIRPGTITGIVGKNGSGKTTLLRLMHGDMKPESGDVFIDERSVGSYKPLELSRKVSFLYQEMYEPFSFTVRDIMNVAGYSRDESVSSYMSALEELGISSLADVSFSSLSGGERRLTTIAAAIYQDSEIMLLDEPTSYLDIDNQIAVHGLMNALKEKGKTLVVVMHDLNAVESLCDDIIMLRGGEVVASGPVDSVLNEGNLSRTFDVPFSEVHLDSDRMFVYRNKVKH